MPLTQAKVNLYNSKATMGIRRQARENALRVLYLWDNCKLELEQAIRSVAETTELNQTGWDFTLKLVRGIVEKQKEIDKAIVQQAKNWTLERMLLLDRNILRIATYEIMNTPETPLNVIINEAIEIAKIYSDRDSGKFVNGILDGLKFLRLEKSNGTPGKD